jgi:amino acid permease
VSLLSEAAIQSFLTYYAVFTVTIAVGLQDRPSTAPEEGVWKSDYKLFNQPSFSDAASAISSLVFSYAGTPAFFSISSEMRDPRHYTKALVVCQTVISTAYIVVGIVVYYYCGTYVSSPALGSAGPVVKKVAYGIALPGLFVTAILLTHVRYCTLLIKFQANQGVDPK